jgi:hypothetical protein
VLDLYPFEITACLSSNFERDEAFQTDNSVQGGPAAFTKIDRAGVRVIVEHDMVDISMDPTLKLSLFAT